MASAAGHANSCTASARWAAVSFALISTANQAALSLQTDGIEFLLLQRLCATSASTHRPASAADHAASSRVSAGWAVTPFALNSTYFQAALGLWVDCMKFPPLQGPCTVPEVGQHPALAAVRNHSSMASAR